MFLKTVAGIVLSFFYISIAIGQSNKKKVVVIADYSKDIFPTDRSSKPLRDPQDYAMRVFLPAGNESNPRADTLHVPWVSYDVKKTGSRYRWEFEMEEQASIHCAILPEESYYATPGDSIYITYNGNDFIFSGNGVEKYRLRHAIELTKKSVKRPRPKNLAHIDLAEYLEFNRYYDKQLEMVMPIIESYKPKLTKTVYDWIKAYTVSGIEVAGRLQQFNRLHKGHNLKRFNATHTMKDVRNVWDTTMYKYWGKWLRKQNFFLDGEYSYIFQEAWRKYNFTSNDSLSNSMFRKELINIIKTNPDYSPLFRERFLIYELNEDVSEELGAWNWFAQSVLKDYYNSPGYPAYKKWVRSLEKSRQYIVEPNGDAPLFRLATSDGKIFTYKGIKGKLAVINFWFTGCESCKEPAKALADLQAAYNGDTSIIFLNVNTDKDKSTWLKNKNAGVYASKGGIHLWTEGQGKKHEIIKDFDVAVFPTVRFIDGYNKMVVDKDRPHASSLSASDMKNLIDQRLFRLKDGPYVFYGNDNTDTVYTIINGSVLKKINTREILVATDRKEKQLAVSLKQQITIPQSEYPAVNKLFALSDIEGNFEAFRKLLKASLVIDDNFNWTFGAGHLVFAGDMFDRGEQVPECLWLIYSLEDKAKAAGGAVHFILGNHEIMNLNGQDKYVKKKYLNNYKLMGKGLIEVFNENSELGRWLRSKNIIEKIGNNLFLHGGVSPAINSLPLTLEQINSAARPYYDKSDEAEKSTDATVQLLFNGRKSPFWYRQYYDNDYFSKSNNEMIYHATGGQLDSTLKKFGVHHIVTGHTIVADTISVHFGNKVINTDVHHAGGKSEALLIEGNNYYRVNQGESKILLFTDGKDADK